MATRPPVHARAMVALLLTSVMIVALLPGLPAEATFPGNNGLIAYVAIDSGGGFDLWVRHPDGAVVRLTTDGALKGRPAVSPDGQQIAIRSSVDGDEEIYVVNIDGSGTTKLTDNGGFDGFPAWSPTGALIVFSSDRHDPGGDVDLYVMGADGSNPHNLTSTPGVREANADWSPDGHRIAFRGQQGSTGSLYVMPAAGGPPTLLVAGSATQVVQGPSWSPDGSRIAYFVISDAPTSIWVVPTDGGAAPVNLSGSAGSDDIHPSWSPDGTRIAFSTDRFSATPIIATMAPDGGTAMPLVTTPADAQLFGPSWGRTVGSATLDPDGDPIFRLYGNERTATAVAVSQDSYPAGGSAAAAVLARADAFPDALAGTPLAVDVDGPMLLTATGSLAPGTQAELLRVVPGGSTVYLLGGTAALGPQVEADVRALGYSTVRLGGGNRFETAVAIAEQLGQPGPLYLADGGTFQAAEVSGVAAAAGGGAVLLTSGSTMPPTTEAYLATRDHVAIYAVGSDAITARPTSIAITGRDAYMVAIKLANTVFGPNPPAAALASGTVFADGLTGGPHIARLGGPLLLSDPAALSRPTHTYLTDHAASIDALYVYGGPAAVADPVVVDAQDAITQIEYVR